MAALTAGHLEVDEAREQRAIVAIRLAVWGDKDDLRARFRGGNGGGSMAGGGRVAGVDEALAAFGLREVAQ